MGCMERSLSLWCFQEYDRTAEDDGMDALLLLKKAAFWLVCGRWRRLLTWGFLLIFEKIPVRQETIEICESFDLNPYKLLSGGSILVGTEKEKTLVQ